jgi:hypothetical protein
MKANVVHKPMHLQPDREEDQMVSHSLADNMAMMSVVTGDDGEYLCFTDNKGGKLWIKIAKPAAGNMTKRALPKTCPKCHCKLRRIDGVRLYCLPGTYIPCTHSCPRH